ncbi:hypothetical protein [Kaistella rhinocerotis]|uniref:hypothetical protein n=1 Tax=Kaistella rhinocerotis TaxID=3026437 RepID=UPI0025568419|nr:hypothetical protein [Kaistella sp. Ran72]
MKTIYTIISLFAVSVSLHAQQITVGEVARQAKWTKLIDEVNNGKQKIKYSDIEGIPYYNRTFLPARVGDTSASVPIRYNSFLDTVEILVNTDVFEIPREESYPKFIFENSGEKLVLVNTHDENAGYFFELSGGKNRLLKKVITKFHDAVPAPNSMIPGTPARFELLKPAYFIKTETGLIRIPKNTKDLIPNFPEREAELSNFIKMNKIKLTSEPDLIKLNNFLNN